MDEAKKLFDDILHQKISFADFSTGLKEIDVTRVNVDFVRKEHVFYFKNGTFLALSLPDGYGLVIADKFDKEKIKEAIFKFDRALISPHEFHVQLAAAGVLSAVGFFLDRRGIYLGQNCNFYLEEWEEEYC